MMRRYTSWALALLFYGSLLSWNIKPSNAEYFLLKASGVHGDNTGRIKDMSIGSASYTDNGYFSDIITKGPWVDVRAYGTALTDAPIQAAFDAHPTGNATIYIPAGHYIIGTELLWNGVDNITIRGDGIGRTILDASALQNIPKRSNLGYSRTWGVLSINPFNGDTGIDAYHYNVVIEGMTIIGSTLQPADANFQKLVVWSTTNNVTFRNCEFIGAYYEMLYGNVSNYKTMKDQTVENCVFRNSVTGNLYNINTGINVENVKVLNNVFDNASIGVNVLGRGTKIRGNHFVNISYIGILAGDGDSNTTKLHDGYDISGNYFRGMGVGAASGATVYGITLATSAKSKADNTTTLGDIISGNSFVDFVSPAGAGSIIGINVEGNAVVSNNVFSGITTNGTGTSDIAIKVNYTTATDNFQRVSILNNVVEDTPITKAGGKGWNFGIYLTGNDNAVYHLGGNKIAGIQGGGYWAFFMGVFPSQPIVTFDGDVFNGNINTHTALNSINNLNTDNTLRNTPIYGDLVHGLRTAISEDIRTAIYSLFTDNATTPSVVGGKIWYTNNTGATTITNFTGGVQGQFLTVQFIDNNTTLATGTSMRLQGAANFVATPNDTITLFYGFGPRWYEVGRSAN